MIFGYLILFISVMISVIAAYYSVAGLTAIFSAAVVPVIIMGGALEAGKIVSTVWLHNNWKRAGVAFKLYLIPAIVFLMLLTSMGIFGFLSKAHLDQNIPTGDAQAKVQIIDDKIATARGNIESDKNTLKQMDAQVNEMLSRSSDNKGTERAVAIRKQQTKERENLAKDIQKNQELISQLNTEREPIAREYRKIEAEVGPIKYVAALLYGAGTGTDVLEKAVRWVIILIVVVFDPLALCLILAANKQLEWARHGRGDWVHDEEDESRVEDTAQRPEPETYDPPPLTPIPAVEENTSNPSTGELPPQEPIKVTAIDPANIALGTLVTVEPPPEDPLTEEQREARELEEIQEFFWRGKMIAKALDAEQDQRVVDAGNQALSDVEPEPADIDLVLEDLARARAEEEKLQREQEEQQQLLDTLAQEFQRVDRELTQAKEREIELQSQVASATFAETLLNSQLDMALDDKDALTDHTRALEQKLEDSTHAVAKLSADLDEQTTEVNKLTAWVEQLQADLRTAIELAAERNEKINELNTLIPGPVTEQVLEQIEQAVNEDIADIERPGDYLKTAEQSQPVDNGRGYHEMYFPKYTPPQADFVQDELPDSGRADFGIAFPSSPTKGDMFLRVDYLPERLFKWNATKWIEIDRASTDRFAYNTAYIEHLINKLRTGEYELDDLSDTERAEVTSYLNGKSVQ